jgi:hypothetical protein
MAKINVSNLHPVGSDLFFDSENYISELSDNELGTINGGIATPPPVTQPVEPPVTQPVEPSFIYL